MAKTLTFKNIPDPIYERLKQSAKANRRSLNSEAIVCLETVLIPTRTPVNDSVLRARELRAALSGHRFLATEIDSEKRSGRA